jgi:hypothetical protein
MKKRTIRGGIPFTFLEIQIGVIVLGTAVGLAIPLIKMAHSNGYSLWPALFIAPLSLVSTVAYLFGIPLLAERIILRLKPNRDNETGVWLGIVIAATWVSLISIIIYLCYIVKK